MESSTLTVASNLPRIRKIRGVHNLSWSSSPAVQLKFGVRPIQRNVRRVGNAFFCVAQKARLDRDGNRQRKSPQNVDLPPDPPKNKKKPYAVPFRSIQRAARADKKLAQMGIEKHLEPPKNGVLVPELMPVAYQVLDAWKALIKGLAVLVNYVPVYGCRYCSEVHIALTGHEMKDCQGPGNGNRRGQHEWVRGTINDVLILIESYHLYDPFGKRIKHENRFDYDRIPAVVELCIQAGVDLPEYPSRRRLVPIRMIGKKVIDRGGFVDEPKRCTREQTALLELDTYGLNLSPDPPPMPDSELRELAERTLEAWETVRRGTAKLMKKYTVKACGYCPEVHVGPWGHNAKLCGSFKHQWRDGKHGWQDATLDEVVPANYVWHVRDPRGPALRLPLKSYYGKAPAVVELCAQAGAKIPEKYKPMMRLDIVIPDCEEAKLVA